MNIDILQIFLQAVNFFVVMGALSFLLYRPILKVLDERSKRIQEGNKAAEAAIKQRDALDDMKSQAKKELDKEKTQVLKKATQDARKTADGIVEKAHSEAQAIVDKAKKQMADEKKQAFADMRKELAEAVLTVSKTVLPQSIDEKKHTMLIDTELDAILKTL